MQPKGRAPLPKEQLSLEKLRTITFGFPQSQWDAAKHEAREQLIAVAKRSGTITYGELASKVRSISFAADDDPFHKLLGQISIEENDAGRGMLSALVILKVGHREGYPGAGFFDLARLLGRHITDRDQFWIEEVGRVIEAWRAATSPPA
jgi:hypothetical protein